MESDDLREAWASLEAHLRRTERLNDALVAQSMTRRAQTSLVREERFLALEIVVNYAGVVALGWFAFDHVHDIWAAVCAVILGVSLIVINLILVGILVAIKRLDFEEPVLAIQMGLERIALRRARLTTAILLAGPLLWTPLSIIGFSLLGLDAVRSLGMTYVGANLAVGALVAAGGWIAARYLSSRLRGSRWAMRAIDALSGSSYREAADFLNTIKRFRNVA
jgi:hypothetical protein